MDEQQTISQTTKKGGFFRAVFSDGDNPSSSRIMTFILTIAVVVILETMFRHLYTIKDAAILGQWLGALPLIIGSLIGVMVAHYTINRGTTSITDILNSVKKKD
jgi:hypothetical protein